MRLRSFTLCTIVLAIATTMFAADAKSPMKPGKWQITITMDMPGMPMKMPPMTFVNCVTKEQAENPQPPKTKQNDDCKVSDYKMDGNVVTWSMKCEKQNMTGEGRITFSSDSYEGESHMKMSDMEVSQKYAGKYLGECDGTEKK
jgi:Protein of unknown function (DUF3617)